MSAERVALLTNVQRAPADAFGTYPRTIDGDDDLSNSPLP